MEYMIVNGELYHHGIKGQRWGIRRYQNDDGTLTEAGRKRYYNSDGTLNYRGLKKKRKDAIDKDPYGKLKKDGGSGRTSEQTARLRNDTIKYGHKGVNRIKDKVSTGQTYSQARRAESIRYGAKTAGLILANAVMMDYVMTGGKGTKNVVKYGERAAKKIYNNSAGILIGSLGIGKRLFDNDAMKKVFG